MLSQPLRMAGLSLTFFSHSDPILFLDIFLGDADGRTLCQQLKETAGQKNIPVVLYSAGNIPRHTLENSMANAFVTKPFDIKQLSEKIKNLLTA